MTRTGDREIVVLSGILPDNPGELACMQIWPISIMVIEILSLATYFALKQKLGATQK